MYGGKDTVISRPGSLRAQRSTAGKNGSGRRLNVTVSLELKCPNYTARVTLVRSILRIYPLKKNTPKRTVHPPINSPTDTILESRQAADYSAWPLRHGAFTRALNAIGVTHIKALIALTTLLILLLSAMSVRAQSSDDTQRSINAIAAQINSITQELNTSKQERASEQNKLLKAEKATTANKQSLRGLEKKIADQTVQAEATQEQIANLQLASDEIALQLTKLIKDQYVQGGDAYLKQILNQENPYALGRLNHYREIFKDAMFNKIKEHAFVLAGLRQQKQSFKALLEQLAADQRSLSSKQAELLSNQSQRRQAIAALDTQLSDKASLLSQLNDDRVRLQALVRQIQQKAEQLAKLSQRPIRALVPGGFMQQRGRLSLPVDGKIVTGFGARIPTSGIRSNGLYFESKQSATVRAIYSGTVIFSDYLKGFGELIIVDHGDDHISLYGHNDRLLKKVGEQVDANEAISQVGTSGGLKQPGLYFEIRQNTQPVNPSLWLAGQ